MKKIYTFLVGILLFTATAYKAHAQCTPQYYYYPSAWTDLVTGGTQYGDFMCQGFDSLYSRVGWEYYDGDGYCYKVQTCSKITIYATNCVNPTSLTVVDSMGGIGTGNVIPGAYSAAACPNSLSFTAPYTGLYYVVFDTDNDCSTSGTNVEGEVSLKLTNAASYPNCTPLAPVNDTICGATALLYNTPLDANTIYGAFVDPSDAAVTNAGFTCDIPNNTLWYSYTPVANGTYDINVTSPLTGGLDSWIGFFSAANCTSSLIYLDCLVGPSPGGFLTNTVTMNTGNTYYFMLDGYNSSQGAFTIELVPNTVGIEEHDDFASSLSVWPNPATELLTIDHKTGLKNVAFHLVNALGQEVFNGNLANNESTILDVSKFANGIYTLRFDAGSGVSRKVVIRHAE